MPRCQPSPHRGVVVSAHPDDAVLSCWNALIRSDVTTVVTVFAGIPPAGAQLSAWDRLTLGTDPARRAQERRVEDRRALEIAGCLPVHLDFLGTAYRPGAVDRAAVTDALSRAIGEAAHVWIPAAVGGHPDHVDTRDIALEVSRGRSRLLYADLPYAARFGWPSWVTGAAAEHRLDVDAWLHAQIDDRGPDRVNPRAHHLDQDTHSSKRHALSHYRSQLPALSMSAGRRFPHGSHWAYEVTWEVA